MPFLLDLETVGSTNIVFSRGATPPPFSIVLTHHQTEGRGRRDRQWISKPGESLALSVLVPRELIESDTASWIPLIAGLSVVSALHELGVTEAGVKWPNDVLVAGNKIAGILCEVLPTKDVVVGVGINIGFESEPPTPNASALDQHCEIAEETPDVFVSSFVSFLRSFLAGDRKITQQLVEETMLTLRRQVEVVESEGPRWRGTATGLDSTGALLVRDETGMTRVVSAADVEHLLQ